MKATEVKEWLRNEVTVAFFERIDIHIADADKMVHKALEDNEKEQAALHNAKYVSFKDVKDVPGDMIYELEGEKDET